jgi:FKBP-type peptidyl-prolyl cis-trans isomerase
MAVAFSYVLYNYSTTAADHKGTEIQDSNQSGPFVAVLGQNPPQMIAGLEQGLIGMKVSGRRQIVIPPELGYGAAGSPPVPPNATLLFIIDLLQAQAVTSAKQPTAMRLPLPMPR